MAILIEEAVTLARAQAAPLPEEYALLSEALGRVLTRDVLAPLDQPPFDRSPLDGYAICAEDVAGASPERPVTLKVVDKLYAGQVSRTAIRPGEAVRLMTGAMLPEGTTGVIRQEDTDLGESRVQVFRGGRCDKNCCRRGEEYTKGALLLPAGTRVDAAALAVAAGVGLAHLPVHRRPRAAILSSGDELCQPGQPLPGGKIYGSNAVYLSARLGQLGAEVAESEFISDNTADIVRALERLRECDLILTTGGVSVGQRDLIPAALEAAGANVIFHGVAIKPGMPTLLAVLGHTVLLGLSGNPFSAAVAFELLLRPILAGMTLDGSLELRWREAAAENDFQKASPTRRFLRARVSGQTVAFPEAQSNGQMRGMVGCNCLIDIPAGSAAVRRGDQVQVLLL